MSELLASLSELLTKVPGLLPTVAALGGAVVGALGTILVTMISNRSAERRHLKELVFGAAVENWKKAAELAAQTPGKHALAPLDDFVLGLLIKADLFVDRKVTKENIRAVLEKGDALSEEIHEWRFKESRQAQEAGL